MKVISDIRIFKDTGTGQIGINNKMMNISARRVAMKLREKSFSLGEYDHLYLCFSPNKPSGAVELDEKVDRYFPWFRNVLIGISPDELSAIEEAKDPALLLGQIENVLIILFGNDPSSSKAIKEAVEDAKKGPEMLMHFKEKKTSIGKATIYLRLLNNASYLPLLSVTNTAGEEIVRKSLPETIDLGTIGEIKLSRKKVTVMPRKNAIIEDAEPISFDINI